MDPTSGVGASSGRDFIVRMSLNLVHVELRLVSVLGIPGDHSERFQFINDLCTCHSRTSTGDLLHKLGNRTENMKIESSFWTHAASSCSRLSGSGLPAWSTLGFILGGLYNSVCCFRLFTHSFDCSWLMIEAGLQYSGIGKFAVLGIASIGQCVVVMV